MRVLGPLTDYLYVKEGRAYADTKQTPNCSWYSELYGFKPRPLHISSRHILSLQHVQISVADSAMPTAHRFWLADCRYYL